MESIFYDITTKTLGKGHYGVVKLGRHCLTGESVAIKIIEKSKLSKDSLNQLGTEIGILFRLSEYEHPNILKLYQTLDTEDKLFLVTEYCGPHACDLHDYLLKKHSRTGLGENEAQIFFIQICSAISYCHSMGIVHRDLKPENILVTDYKHMYSNSSKLSTLDLQPNQSLTIDHNQYPLLKLIDFGFANQWMPEEKMRTSCGTLAYSAPELLLGEPYDGSKVDVWGLGLMLYILLYGGNPFMQINDNETLTKILDCSYATPPRDNVNPDAIELLNSMIKRNPDTRLSIESILRHKWFSSLSKQSTDITSPIELSESEKSIHDLVMQEMLRFKKFSDSGSRIEASLKNARYSHRLIDHNSIQPASPPAKHKVIGGSFLRILARGKSAFDKQRGDHVDQALGGSTIICDKSGLLTSELTNDDYIYATYQLTKDSILRTRQEKLNKTYAGNRVAGAQTTLTTGSVPDSVGQSGGQSDQLTVGGPRIVGRPAAMAGTGSEHQQQLHGSAMAFALPLARKCSLVSEES